MNYNWMVEIYKTINDKKIGEFAVYFIARVLDSLVN